MKTLFPVPYVFQRRFLRFFFFCFKNIVFEKHKSISSSTSVAPHSLTILQEKKKFTFPTHVLPFNHSTRSRSVRSEIKIIIFLRLCADGRKFFWNVPRRVRRGDVSWDGRRAHRSPLTDSSTPREPMTADVRPRP